MVTMRTTNETQRHFVQFCGKSGNEVGFQHGVATTKKMNVLCIGVSLQYAPQLAASLLSLSRHPFSRCISPYVSLVLYWCFNIGGWPTPDRSFDASNARNQEECHLLSLSEVFCSLLRNKRRGSFRLAHQGNTTSRRLHSSQQPLTSARAPKTLPLNKFKTKKAVEYRGCCTVTWPSGFSQNETSHDVFSASGWMFRRMQAVSSATCGT